MSDIPSDVPADDPLTHPVVWPSAWADAAREPLPIPTAWVPPPPDGPPPGWGPQPPPRPARRTLRGVIAAVSAVGLLVVGGGVGVALGRLADRSPSSTSSPLGSSSGGSGPSASAGSLSVDDIAARVDPSVVDITVTYSGQSGQAAGTGMVIGAGGLVLTNNHVIEDAATISVLIGGSGTAHSAVVKGTDPTADVAVIQLQGVSGLHPVDIGTASSVGVGDAVVALGNALGRQGTPQVATGKVTALDQTITAGGGGAGAETLHGLIQTDAHILPGDSGGPLVDTSGKVVGMDTAASVAGRRFNQSTAGYAIPIDTAMTIARQVQSGQIGGSILPGERPLLGVQVQDATQGDASSSGALVVGLQSGGPAEAAGIASGDVITAVGGSTVSDAASLRAALLGHHVGDRVSVTWVTQSGEQHEATVQLVSGPPA